MLKSQEDVSVTSPSLTHPDGIPVIHLLVGENPQAEYKDSFGMVAGWIPPSASLLGLASNDVEWWDKPRSIGTVEVVGSPRMKLFMPRRPGIGFEQHFLPLTKYHQVERGKLAASRILWTALEITSSPWGNFSHNGESYHFLSVRGEDPEEAGQVWAVCRPGCLTAHEAYGRFILYRDQALNEQAKAIQGRAKSVARQGRKETLSSLPQWITTVVILRENDAMAERLLEACAELEISAYTHEPQVGSSVLANVESILEKYGKQRLLVVVPGTSDGSLNLMAKNLSSRSIPCLYLINGGLGMNEYDSIPAVYSFDKEKIVDHLLHPVM